MRGRRGICGRLLLCLYMIMGAAGAAEEGGQDLAGAAGQFAIESLNGAAKGKTLVILLIDRSRSIVNKDLPIVAERMNHYFRQTRHLKEEHKGRLEWALYAYGKDAALTVAATGDRDAVMKGLMEIEADTSGEENVLAAVNAALDKYGDGGYKHVLMAVLTDERGTDTQNDVLLEKTLARLKKSGARLFVFGREANFGTKRKRVWIETKGQRYWSFSEQGPECPEPQLWQEATWWGWWVSDTSNIPSGFPMYALNRLVLASGGTYFLLVPESKYDERKLLMHYAPDVCSRAQYAKRIENNALKKELAAAWKEIAKMHFLHDFREEEQIDREMVRAARLREYCEKQANRIAYLRRHTPPSGRNRRRWLAHADVTYCQLLRLKFLYGQYRHALTEFDNHAQYKGRIPENKRLITHGIKTGGRYRGGRAAVDEMDQLKMALEYAFQQHRDTPWEVLLRKMSGCVNGSFIWKITDLPKPGGNGYEPPPV